MAEGSALRKLLKGAQRKGWTVEQARRSGHWHLKKEGHGLIVISSSPSDGRSLKNAEALLKKAGAL